MQSIIKTTEIMRNQGHESQALSESERKWQEERRQRMLDPVQVTECEEGAKRSLREIEEGVLFHLADLLSLAVYRGHDSESVVLRGIKLLKPFAAHSRPIGMILCRLGHINGSLKYIPADYLNEDSNETAPAVLTARLRERQQFLTTSVLSDLKSQKKWVAEAKRTQRQVARAVKTEGGPATAA